MLFSYVLLSDFYPLYDSQLDTCPPAIAPSAANNNLKTESVANINKTISHEWQKCDRPAITEFILAFWVFTLFCEEIRQVFSTVIIICLEPPFLRSCLHPADILSERKQRCISTYFGIYWIL